VPTRPALLEPKVFHDALNLIPMDDSQHPLSEEIPGDVDCGNCRSDQYQWAEFVYQKLEHESLLDSTRIIHASGRRVSSVLQRNSPEFRQ
jgi:hypothetical protein